MVKLTEEERKERRRASSRKYYLANKQKKQEQGRRAARKRRRAYHAYVKSRGARCELCGDEQPPEVFDCHHVDPANKVEEVNVDWVFSRSEAEGAKCALLCSNCHRMEHAALHLFTTTFPEGYTTPDGSTVVIPTEPKRKDKWHSQSSQSSHQSSESSATGLKDGEKLQEQLPKERSKQLELLPKPT